MTRPLTIEIPHALGLQEAHRRIDAGFDRLEHQFGGGGLGKLEKRWSGDTLSFNAQVVGQALSGRLEVRAESVLMELDLPPFLAMMTGMLKGRLQREGQLLLEKR